MENSSVENVASSLVREYLSRKGLKGTLQTMDSEMPRTDGSISNRLQLAKELHLEYLMKKNKVQECTPPLRAMLEVMTKYFLQKIDVGREDKRQSSGSRPSSRMSSERPSSRTASHSKAPSDDSGFHNNQSNHHAKRASKGSALGLDIHNVEDEEGMGSTAISDVSKAGVHRLVVMSSLYVMDTTEATQTKKSRPSSSRGLRSGMMAGPIMSSQDVNSPISKYSESKVSSSTLSSSLTRKDSSSDSNLGSDKSLYVAKDPAKKTVSEEETDYFDSKRPTSGSKLVKSTSLDDKAVSPNLKTLLFGSASEQFNAEWRNQSLSFCDTEGLRFGIVQNKGGPCGALAAIQACMLKRLLFGEARDKTANAHSPDSRLRSECLALGLADLLWRAGRKKLAVVAMPSGRKQFQGGARYRQDNLTETLMLNTVDSQGDLEAFIRQNISLFETNQYATILVLYSAILSRSIDHVISDMDEPTTKLIGAHGYCTQEMVNLFLTGKAVSNVFNDTVELDSGGGETMILRGVGSRSEIGLLSLFEHYGSCQVGTYMKTPRYPIWVVCSESHFSVLFCIRKELMNDWKYERRFDLYYYDGLARQDEQIRLTVVLFSSLTSDNLHPYQPPGEGELVPPLEHCIRTKWNDATVDWNGTDPIL
uniref:Ubiquitin carboxyl-terminal hydrolase MINDY n=1 Tax=Branchiostoma floridae TaxID=7739 RepID=C3ZVV4_BRAFL|eukprot:XP_002587304.1 hypothetical protein BRAFLDRAFT_239753 [Branchiostoma floridae]